MTDRSRLRTALGAMAICCAANAASGPATAKARLVAIPFFESVNAVDVYGINDHNDITGSFTQTNGQVRGYATEGLGLAMSWDTFDYVGAAETRPRGISNDRYVDGYAPSSGLISGIEFWRSPDPVGAINPILSARHNGKPLDGVAQQISPHHRFVGDYWHMVAENEAATGYSGKGGHYGNDVVMALNTSQAHPRGMNDLGEVVGYFVDNDGGATRGFFVKDGVATPVDYPDPSAAAVFLEGINNAGMVAGAWVNSDGTAEHAFLFDSQSDTFLPIDVPGATFAAANGINDHGIVTVSADNGIYVYCPSSRHCPNFNPAREVPLHSRWVPATPTDSHRSAGRHLMSVEARLPIKP